MLRLARARLAGSKYFNAGDFDSGETLTIADIAQDEMKDGDNTVKKWVVRFKEVERGIVLNETRRLFLDEAFKTTEKAIGKQILVRKGKVSLKGKPVDSIVFDLPEGDAIPF